MTEPRHAANVVELKGEYYVVFSLDGPISNDTAKYALEHYLEHNRCLYGMNYAKCTTMLEAQKKKEEMYQEFIDEYINPTNNTSSEPMKTIGSLGKGILIAMVILGCFSFLQKALNSL